MAVILRQVSFYAIFFFEHKEEINILKSIVQVHMSSFDNLICQYIDEPNTIQKIDILKALVKRMIFVTR